MEPETMEKIQRDVKKEAREQFQVVEVSPNNIEERIKEFEQRVEEIGKQIRQSGEKIKARDREAYRNTTAFLRKLYRYQARLAAGAKLRAAAQRRARERMVKKVKRSKVRRKMARNSRRGNRG